MIAGQSAQSAYDSAEPEDAFDDLSEAVGMFNWEMGGEYVATIAGFNGEDAVITVEHIDCYEVNTGTVGIVYSTDDLGEWFAAFNAFEAVTPKDENGNTPRFAPLMSNGVIL